MRPSIVRKRIIEEHDDIRTRLDQLERDCEALAREGARALEAALQRARAFYETLRSHIELEDAILVPAMRQADAWGDQRAESLLAHHRQQQDELRELAAQSSEGVDPESFTRRLRKLIEDVRVDMEHEERSVLSPELLRDDLVGINVEDG